MKAIVFDTHKFELPYFTEMNLRFAHELKFLEIRLNEETASLAAGQRAVCLFTHDQASASVLRRLKEVGVEFIALRSAGFNHVDLGAAKELGIRIARVPAYSPYSVAEHSVALMLALNRKLCRAVARVKELNFSLDGLVGFDFHGKTVGIIGAGKIGAAAARILSGFGCELLLHDPHPNEELIRLGARYVRKEEIFERARVISLHLPLSDFSRHIIDSRAIAQMRDGVMLINTGRGGLIDTQALIQGLKSGKIGAAGLDVYEEEENIFSRDLSDSVLQDDLLARLMTFPNVMITAHQAFLTQEALHNIVETTLENLSQYERGETLKNEVAMP